MNALHSGYVLRRGWLLAVPIFCNPTNVNRLVALCMTPRPTNTHSAAGANCGIPPVKITARQSMIVRAPSETKVATKALE
jgi:hypothetical protein